LTCDLCLRFAKHSAARRARRGNDLVNPFHKARPREDARIEPDGVLYSLACPEAPLKDQHNSSKKGHLAGVEQMSRGGCVAWRADESSGKDEIGMELKQLTLAMSAFSPAASLRRLSLAAVVVLPMMMAYLICLPVAPSSAADATTGRAKHGEAIFKERCIACHNKAAGDTSPFGPPNLSGIFRGPKAITTRQAADIIANGKGTMPPWSSVLTKSDIDDVIAFLKTR
jgi:mono/diheme cytochrome c family protein